MIAAELLERARKRLLAERAPEGHWEGRLASSALATATAVAALALHARASTSGEPGADAALVRNGIRWLVDHRNADHGWGDTPASASNISTTVLVWAALAFADEGDAVAADAAARATTWIEGCAGGCDARRLSAAIAARYGRDRTFSVPILTMCALAGRLGREEDAWDAVPALPFELAAAPRRLFGLLRLPVVSYALPALIAMGLVRHRRRPARNLALRVVRRAAERRVLDILDTLQPSNGGFLEATPLTSFVTMSLVGAGEADHPVASRALGFLRASVRDDGSWPVDTNLATWVTTLAVNALHAAGTLACVGDEGAFALRQWLVRQQHVREHVYTGAAPGGWAWTPLPGGVPDADDTAGAVLALAHLPEDGAASAAAASGIAWLAGLQNSDGGIPTFCRGWGALPFDRSGADLTAHAVRAWDAWLDRVDAPLRARVERALDSAARYLRSCQRPDGSFVPLWFGNERAPGEENPTYGTARVIPALVALDRRGRDTSAALRRALEWLLAARNADGGWGGDRGVPSSIEETALAVGALAAAAGWHGGGDAGRAALEGGCQWLAVATGGGARFPPAPIGLYFAKLWYSEELYPLIFALDGLGRTATRL